MGLHEEVNLILENHDLRKTSFRKDVLNVFLSNRGRALSSAELEDYLKEADRITLYRTLKSFEEKGVIHQAVDGSNLNKYALCSDDCSTGTHQDEHAHFHCSICGETQCLYHSLKTLEYRVPEKFVVTGSDVVLTGKCPKCVLADAE
jgi:Fur family ferric uptake transcriptional regulator